MTHAPAVIGALAVSTDAQGVVTSCSPAVAALVGSPSAALVGHPFPMEIFQRDELERRAEAAGVPVGPELLAINPIRFDRRRGPRLDLGDLDRRGPDQAPAPGRSVARATSGPAATTEESSGTTCSWTVIGADGAPRVIAVTVKAILDESRDVIGFAAQGVDVTEEQQTSRLLAQALRQEQESAQRLAELDQLRSDFVTTAGHELRTPLTNVLGFVELLEGGIGDADACGRYIAAIRRNIGRLQELAEGLLLLSTPSAGRVGVMTPLDLRRVVEGAAARICGLGESRGLEVCLGAAKDPVEVLGDASRLEFVVDNLLENAVTFTPAGGKVWCRVGTSGGEAVIEVADTGPGVPRSELPHLFSPFFRGAAAQEGAVPGSGLGLCIASAVAEEHGGRLLVSDNDPHGAVFTVRLPLRPRDVPEEGAHP